MIVADVNLIAYLLIRGKDTEHAERALARDRKWIARKSYRFELLNVLATNVRQHQVRMDQVEMLWRKTFRLVTTPTEVDPIDTLKLSVESKVATYDCEYVLLARKRRIRVVTNDKEMLSHFPDVAVSVKDFADGK